MTGRSTPPGAAGGPVAPERAGPRPRARWPGLLAVLAVVAVALVVVPGFTRASAPGPAPARLAWWTPPAHSDVVLHLWAANSCEHEDGWFTTRTALEHVAVDEGDAEIVVTAHLAAESLRSSDAMACDRMLRPIAVDVRLRAPLGDRVVLDGRCPSPAPPVGPAQRPGDCP